MCSQIGAELGVLVKYRILVSHLRGNPRERSKRFWVRENVLGAALRNPRRPKPFGAALGRSFEVLLKKGGGFPCQTFDGPAIPEFQISLFKLMCAEYGCSKLKVCLCEMRIVMVCCWLLLSGKGLMHGQG